MLFLNSCIIYFKEKIISRNYFQEIFPGIISRKKLFPGIIKNYFQEK